MAVELAHIPTEAPDLAEQWQRLAAWRRLAASHTTGLDTWTADRLDDLITWEADAIELAEGDSLAHTDLHSYNVIVGTDGPMSWIYDSRHQGSVRRRMRCWTTSTPGRCGQPR
jgi:hypothetical protein